MNRLFAECLGTFALVFAGAGAIVVDTSTGAQVTHVGVALTFGLVVMAMVYAFGEISGAHVNPAVTTAFALAGRFAWKGVPGYVGAQCAGALGAALALDAIFPASETLGETAPSGGVWQSWTLELIMTTMLIIVILRVATGAKEKGIMAGAAIGAVVAFEALFGGPVSGASMNPARSLGPTLASGRLEFLWIYLTAPMLAAPLSVGLDRLVAPSTPARA